MNKNQHDPFCKKELQPLLVLLVVVLVLTIGWVTYHEIKMKRDPVYAAKYHSTIHHRDKIPLGQAVAAINTTSRIGTIGTTAAPVAATVATGGIPPIKLSDVMTHPNFGQDCTKCHEVVGPKSKAPIEGGKILVTATMPHPYWGACNVCHTVVDALGKPVALTAVDPRSILGIELTQADTLMTTRLDLPDKKGPIITAVFPGGLGDDLGMQTGDMFYLVEDRKVETIAELERALGAFAAGDVVRVTLWRQRRQKIFRFSLPDVTAQMALGGMPNVQTLFDPSTVMQVDPNTAVAQDASEASVLAVASTGKDVNSAVSNELGVSPYFIVVDLKKNTYNIVQNAGGTGSQVAQDLMDMGTEAVICGSIGQGMAGSFTNLGIKMYPGVSGDVKGAINAFKQGTLKEATQAGGVAPTGPGLSGKRRTL